MMQMAGRNQVPLEIPARYMAVSIISLLIWLGITPWMLPKPMSAPLSFGVIAWVHLLTIGAIGSMILGASIQLVPVALQVPYPFLRWAKWSIVVWLLGMVMFEIGFSREILELLGPGATLLGIVFLGYAIAITKMFIDSPDRDVVAWHLLFAAWLSILGMSLGWMLALTNVNGVLGGRLLPILAAHIVTMIGGWVAFMLIGVGYRLIGMFTLADKALNHSQALSSLVFMTTGVLAIVAAIVFEWPRLVITAGALLLAWGVIVSSMEITRMYQRRMRRAVDIHMPFAVAAFAFMVLCAISLVVITQQAHPLDTNLTLTTIWLALVGTYMLAIQGFFYKIATFLIWVKTYSPMAGRVAVPQLDTMYNRRVAYAGLIAWLASVLAVAAILMGWLPQWFGWSMGFWIAGVCFAINVVKISRHWWKPVVTAPIASRGPAMRLTNKPGAS